MKTIFSKITTIICLLAPLAGFAQSARLLTTITNPIPDEGGYFGRTVVAMGSDRWLVGAPNAGVGEDEAVGAAYLFSTNGTLLTTFTNPAPSTDAGFGASMTALGSDRVIIGTPGPAYSGVAYLFSTNGTLITTFTNPTPVSEDYFGYAIAAVGNDRVLIGAPYDDTAAPDAGAAYLFSTNGTLLATILPLSAGIEQSFGFSVAAVGSDRLLIGAPTAGSGSDGVAYLFTTNGVFVTNFYKFHPFSGLGSDVFGLSVAAFGSDRVLIGAPYDDSFGFNGAAHLFSTNGTWLASFSPVNGSYFGVSVAQLGSDGVLVGAGTGGAAYLFSTNGTLRAAFSPADGATAAPVVALGTDRVLCGSGAERAYLFSTETELPRLSVTITTNPPQSDEGLGYSVAMVGSDRVIVGDPYNVNDIGAAYLFGSSGTLLTTFTNPAPAAPGQFGYSVAALGSDCVLMGAPTAESGYLYRTDGTLLTTFTNPYPSAVGLFGASIAAVGNDRVLIGAAREAGGKCFLFGTNGTLLATFTNPTPTLVATLEGYDEFGRSVAVLGNNRLLIGGAVNKVHLFNTNGTLLNTFTNPTPVTNKYEYFGAAVAAMGSDRVLIGARTDDTGLTNVGAAYLFSVNGTLLSTFTNPAPVAYDEFGSSIAAVGSDRVLIGTWGDNASAGAAYLFSTNGTLLTTFTNPTPATGDWFGYSVAAVGNDRALIGAFGDQNGLGAAYLFNTDGTLLTTFTAYSPLAQNVIVSWPRIAAVSGFVLDETVSPSALAWSQVSSATYQTNASGVFIRLPAPAGNKFYRLRKP